MRLRLFQGTKSYRIRISRAHGRQPDGIYNIYTYTHHRDSWEVDIILYKLRIRVVVQNRYLVIVLGVRLLNDGLVAAVEPPIPFDR